MKTIKRISFFAAVFAASACNQPAKQQETTKTDTAAVKTVDAQVVDTANTADVFTAYIGLKDEFLKSNVTGIKTAASALETKLAAIKGCSEAASFARQIAGADDITSQHSAFLLLSKDVVTLVKGAKFKTAAIYVDFCPMADEGKGGYWLSLDKKIANPYFPEHMKECGMVKEKIN